MQFSASLLITIGALVSGISAQKTPAKPSTVDSCEQSHMNFKFSSCQSFLSNESAPSCPTGTEAVCRFAPIDYYAKNGVSVSQQCKTFIKARNDESYYYFCQKQAASADPCPESPYTPSMKTCQENIPSEKAPVCPAGTKATCRFAPTGVLNPVSQTCKNFIKARGGEPYYYTCK